MGTKRRQVKRERGRSEPVQDALVVGLGGRGDGVVRLDSGERVFVSGGAPGDRVSVRLTGRRAGVARGEIVEVLTSGQRRVQPFCAVADACGGCTWQHVDIAAQRDEKRQLARRALGDLAQTAPWLGDLPSKRWRRRVRAHLRPIGGKLAVGFHGQRSHRLVPTSSCPVLVEPLEAVLEPIRAWLDSHVHRAEIAAVGGREGVVAVIHAKPRQGASAPAWTDPNKLLARLGLVGLTLHFGKSRQHIGRDVVSLAESAPDQPIWCSGDGFCQAGSDANKAILTAVDELLALCPEIQTAQEFFSGSGNLTSRLCGHVASAQTVERDERAVARARKTFSTDSAATKGTDLTIESGLAADLARRPGPAELWLLDPGRPGAPELVDLAASWQPARILYVSCAFDTLGRDLKRLQKAGYNLIDARLIDTFVHTPHFEIAVLLGLS